MAMHKSAKTRIRRNARRNVLNTARRSGTRTAIKKVDEAVKAGDYAAAMEALKNAQPEIQRSAGKGLLHKRTASRKISRLSARVKTLKK
ncbi:MAG: 30S ribosomal protein S20 [Alphaproteobacteria bacterium]|nr:30S ribosomal protein S20 [Alphaproteobacteria bacterium]